MSSRYVEIRYDEKVTETADAVLIRIDDDEYWLPWSCIEDNGRLAEYEGRLYLKQWKADQEEIPYD